jgi:hypothetical protein
MSFLYRSAASLHPGIACIHFVIALGREVLSSSLVIPFVLAARAPPKLKGTLMRLSTNSLLVVLFALWAAKLGRGSQNSHHLPATDVTSKYSVLPCPRVTN